MKFLQACGRIMRPSPGKDRGILIDHSGAVFRHGFPDEDTEWPLNGNADSKFKEKHDKGETEKAFYCSHCEVAYKGSEFCPQCGRKPAKPPRSIFAPDPVRPANELLTEAERNGNRSADDREARVRHWFLSITVAKKRNGTFLMAAQIYKQKYSTFPPDDFPCNPPWSDRRKKITDVYPNWGNRKSG